MIIIKLVVLVWFLFRVLFRLGIGGSCGYGVYYTLVDTSTMGGLFPSLGFSLLLVLMAGFAVFSWEFVEDCEDLFEYIKEDLWT